MTYEETIRSTIRSYLQETKGRLLVLAKAPPMFTNETCVESLLAVVLENPFSFFKRNVEDGLKLACEGTNTGKLLAVYMHKVILSLQLDGTIDESKIEVRFINTLELCNELIRGNPVWVGLIRSLQCMDRNSGDSGSGGGGGKCDLMFLDEEMMQELVSPLYTKSPTGMSNGDGSLIRLYFDDDNFYSCGLSLANGLLKKLKAKERAWLKQKKIVDDRLLRNDLVNDHETIIWVLELIYDSLLHRDRNFSHLKDLQKLNLKVSQGSKSCDLLQILQSRYDVLKDIVDTKIEQEKQKNRILNGTSIPCSTNSLQDNSQDICAESCNQNDSDEVVLSSFASKLNMAYDDSKQVQESILSDKSNTKYKRSMLESWHRRLTIYSVAQYFIASEQDYLTFRNDIAEEVSATVSPSKVDSLNAEMLAVLQGGQIDPFYAKHAIHAVQSGSYLYGLSTESSDKDYDVVYLCPALDIFTSLTPPARLFESHSSSSVFATDKAGEVEFNGYELSRYVELLMKGYPKTVELLFIPETYEHPIIRKWPWNELVNKKEQFLNHVTVSQYLGWVGIKLSKFKDTVKFLDDMNASVSLTAGSKKPKHDITDANEQNSILSLGINVDKVASLSRLEVDVVYNKVSAASKLAYHSLSKLFEVHRILDTTDLSSQFYNDLVGVISKMRELVEKVKLPPYKDIEAEQQSVTSELRHLSAIWKDLSSHQQKTKLDCSGSAHGGAVFSASDCGGGVVDGMPIVVFQGIERDFILFVRNIKLLFSKYVKGSKLKDSYSQDVEVVSLLGHVSAMFHLVSKFISFHLNRLSDINHSDSKHRVSKKSRKLANKAKREEADKPVKTVEKAIIQKSNDSFELSAVDKEDIYRENSPGPKIKMRESVNWPIIAEWLLGVRMRQLREEYALLVSQSQSE